MFSCAKLKAQVTVVNKKGTIISIDSSKWNLSGTNLINKNTGNVGIGNPSPSYKLDVTGKLRVSDSLVVNTARISTLNSGSTNDSIVVADATTGILKRVNPAAIIREPWNKIGGTSPSTQNSDSIYILGNVGIGKNPSTSSSIKLDVSGRINADSTISAPNYTSTIQSSASGSSYTWNLNSGANTVWTLAAGSNTLTITNAKAGMYGLIRLINSGTSTLTFASGSASNKVINGGGGVALLTQTASAVDILTFFYDGSVFWWTIGNNYN